jgi:hypothetical protein
MKRSTRLAMLGALLSLNVFAQEDFDPETQSFFDYRTERMEYFDSVSLANNGDLHGTVTLNLYGGSTTGHPW